MGYFKVGNLFCFEIFILLFVFFFIYEFLIVKKKYYKLKVFMIELFNFFFYCVIFG